MISIALIAPAFASTSTFAQDVYEDYKFSASDTSTNDQFGVSVGISNNAIIVGALGTNDAGFGTGSAYIFDTVTGQQLFELNSPNPTRQAFYGYPVAICNSIAIVGSRGEPVENPNGFMSPHGAAYVYNTENGEQLFQLTASDFPTHNSFGRSVDISSTTAIVGSSLDHDIAAHSGAAYLFDITTGEELFKLKASDASENDAFGVSVGVSGYTAIVGAYRSTSPAVNSGAAYLFDTQTGEQIAKLRPTQNPFHSIFFGQSVAISGNTAIVGAPNDVVRGVRTGAAFLFDATTGERTFRLIPSDAEESDSFGTSVNIVGTTAIVGSLKESGAVYMFDTRTGRELRKLLSSEIAPEPGYGISVAIAGTHAVVGSHYDPEAGSDSGSVYKFTIQNTSIADLTNDGNVNFYDLSQFIRLYYAQDLTIDFDDDGSITSSDVQQFVSAYMENCS